jgi:hypothetical protein
LRETAARSWRVNSPCSCIQSLRAHVQMCVYACTSVRADVFAHRCVCFAVCLCVTAGKGVFVIYLSVCVLVDGWWYILCHSTYVYIYMCVCVCVCVYIYIYMECSHVCAFVNALANFACVYMFATMSIYIPACTLAYIYIPACTLEYIYIPACTLAYIYTHLHACLHIYTYLHAGLYMCVKVPKHVYIHTCMHFAPQRA